MYSSQNITQNAQTKRVNLILSIAIAFCVLTGVTFFSLSGALLPLGIPVSASATVVSESVTLSYTPTFNTQFSVSVPTGLTMNTDGSATSLSIKVASWSDFPLNKQLYCNLAGVTALSNGNESIDLIVKNGEETVGEGDTIDTFSPATVSSESAADFIVLTVEPSEKPSKTGTYSGNLSFEIGVVGE